MTTTMTSMTRRSVATVAAARAGKLMHVGTCPTGALRPQSQPQGYPAIASIGSEHPLVSALEWGNSDRRFAKDEALAGGPPMQ